MRVLSRSRVPGRMRNLLAAFAVAVAMIACGNDRDADSSASSAAQSAEPDLSLRKSAFSADSASDAPDDFRPPDKGGRPAASGIFLRQPEDHQVAIDQTPVSWFFWEVQLQAGDEFRWRVTGGQGARSVCGSGVLRLNVQRSYISVPDDQPVVVPKTGVYWAACIKRGAQPLANDGAQVSIRVARPSTGEEFESASATLIIAPTWGPTQFIDEPQTQIVPAGESATFKARVYSTTVGAPVNASLWQWYRDGAPIAGATGPTLTIPTQTSEAGSSSSIVAKYHGDYERLKGLPGIESQPVVLDIVPDTTVVGANGGGVPGPNGSSLGVPEGALAGEAGLSLRAEPLPSALTNIASRTLGDVLVVSGPVGTKFYQPVELRVPVPDDIPDGLAIAVERIDVPSRPGADSAAYRGLKGVPRDGRNAAAVPRAAVACVNVQNISNGTARALISSLGRYVGRLVPASDCDFGSPQQVSVPTDTEQACLSQADFVDASLGAYKTLLSRHVDCRKSETGGSGDVLSVNLVRMPDGSYQLLRAPYLVPVGGVPESWAYGVAKFKYYLSIHGPSDALKKRVKLRVELVSFVPLQGYPANAPRPSSVVLQPQFNCNGPVVGTLSSTCSGQGPA